MKLSGQGHYKWFLNEVRGMWILWKFEIYVKGLVNKFVAMWPKTKEIC